MEKSAAAMRVSFGCGEPEPAAEPASKVNMEDSYAIVVVGASGDLAKKKTYPAIFKLFLNGLLPPAFKVWGYARSASEDAAFREKMRGWLEKYAKGDTEKLDAFLAALVYHQGQYNSSGMSHTAPVISSMLLVQLKCLVRAIRRRGFRQAQRRRDCLGGGPGCRRKLPKPGLLSRYPAVSLRAVVHVHGAHRLDSCHR